MDDVTSLQPTTKDVETSTSQSIIDNDTTTKPPGRNLFDTELILSVYILHVNEYIKLDFMSVQMQHTCYLQLLVDHSTDVNKIHTFSFHTTGQTQIYQLQTLLDRSTGIYRQGEYSLLL